MIRPRHALSLAAALAVPLAACAALRPSGPDVDREDLSLPEPEAHVPIYWAGTPPCGVMPIARIEGGTRAALRVQAVKAGANAVIDAGRRIEGARSRMTLYSGASREFYWGMAVRISSKCHP